MGREKILRETYIMCILSVSFCQFQRSSSTSEYRISKLIMSGKYFLSSLISIYKLCSHCPGPRYRHANVMALQENCGMTFFFMWPWKNSERYCRVDTASIYIISNNAPSGQWCWRQESKRLLFVCAAGFGLRFEWAGAKNWTAWSFPSCLRRIPGVQRVCWRTEGEKKQNAECQ